MAETNTKYRDILVHHYPRIVDSIYKRRRITRAIAKKNAVWFHCK